MYMSILNIDLSLSVIPQIDSKKTSNPDQYPKWNTSHYCKIHRFQIYNSNPKLFYSQRHSRATVALQIYNEANVALHEAIRAKK